MKRVVIIGGSFCGSEVARRLENKLSVTLIDKNDYFEFTPSILKLAVRKGIEKKIRVKHSDHLKKSKIIVSEVKDMGRDFIKIGGNKKIDFDYLVIASGATYAPSSKEMGTISAGNSQELEKNFEKLKKAKKVLIIGGGLVGTELAGEICTYYKDKEVTIINKSETLMERNRPKAIRLAHKFLEKKGVKLLMGNSISSKKDRYLITEKGERIDADIIFNCVGNVPNSAFMRKNFSETIDERGYLRVNEFLHLQDLENVFVGGDVSSVREEKTAQAAEKHAKIIARNIMNMENNKELERYESKKGLMVISLGKWNGILDSGVIVCSGLLPALAKWIIEKKTMWKHML